MYRYIYIYMYIYIGSGFLLCKVLVRNPRKDLYMRPLVGTQLKITSEQAHK